jgi:hypothetical protein
MTTSILAWAALKLHETHLDLDFLQEIYVPLVRWNASIYTLYGSVSCPFLSLIGSSLN